MDDITVAFDRDGKPITTGDLEVGGAMTAWMRNTINPTLMCTAEYQPCLVHAGPFANIAVGQSSIIGDSMAPNYRPGDWVMVDGADRVPSPPGVFVIHDGFGLVVKQLEVILGTRPPMVKLSTVNKAYPPDELPVRVVQVLGRVVAKWQWT